MFKSSFKETTFPYDPSFLRKLRFLRRAKVPDGLIDPSFLRKLRFLRALRCTKVPDGLIDPSFSFTYKLFKFKSKPLPETFFTSSLPFFKDCECECEGEAECECEGEAECECAGE
jgi:hypothetical protein